MDRKTLKHLLFGEFSAKRMVKSFIFIYVFLCIWAYFFTDGMIFKPQLSTYQDTKNILKVKVTDRVQISAIYLPNSKAKYTILYSHGNAEDLGDLIPLLQELRSMGFAVFAYDYEGYGTSQGTPSEANAYRDIDAAYNYLTKDLAVPTERIIAYGRSVGTGSAVDLAARQPLAGLILESPFITAFRVLTRIPIFPIDKFRNIDKIKNVRCPILVMHSKTDEIIPFQHGQEVFAAANEPKHFLWVDGASHNNLMEVANVEYAKTLGEFSALIQQSQKAVQ